MTPRVRGTTIVRAGLVACQGFHLLLLITLVALVVVGAPPALAQEAEQLAGQEGAVGGLDLRFMAAALAAGLAAIGAGIAVGIAGAAAIGAVAEKPELLGRSLIFVGLAEGIAIYGLIIAFMVMGG